MNNIKKNVLSIIGIVVLMILIAGGTYAAFIVTQSGSTNTIQTGTVSFSYTQPSSNVTLSSAYPVTDATGKTGDYFEFSVSATTSGEHDTNYYVYYVLDSNNTMSQNDIRLYLTTVSDNVETVVAGFPRIAGYSDEYSSGYLLDSGIFETNSNTLSKTYRLRMWISQDYTDNSGSKTFKITVNTYGTAIAE